MSPSSRTWSMSQGKKGIRSVLKTSRHGPSFSGGMLDVPSHTKWVLGNTKPDSCRPRSVPTRVCPSTRCKDRSEPTNSPLNIIGGHIQVPWVCQCSAAVGGNETSSQHPVGTTRVLAATDSIKSAYGGYTEQARISSSGMDNKSHFKACRSKCPYCR